MAELLIAKVAIDSPLPQLDHYFDYLIPENLKESIQPGVRVRVPFRNRRVDGFVVDVSNIAETSKRLASIEKVVSAEAVLLPEILNLCKLVAHRCVGTLHDVLRSAVPPRHARAEKYKFELSAKESSPKSNQELISYPNLNSFLENRLNVNLAVLTLAISDRFENLIVELTENHSLKILVVTPDQYDSNYVADALANRFSKEEVAIFSSSHSAERRYLEFLKVLRGVAGIVIGTRNAVFAPMINPDLIVVYDDGDDLLSSPQAPYWNARDVAIWRSELEECKVLFVSRAQSIEAAQLIDSGQAIALAANNIGKFPIQVIVTGDDYLDDMDPVARSARIPSAAFKAIRTGLEGGKVLISVPRKGYQPVVACVECREILSCSNCQVRLAIANDQNQSQCQRCGHIEINRKCRNCGSSKLRSIVTGVERTAEEFGKAFAGFNIKYIHGENRLDQADFADVNIILATPGTEPQISYQTIVILDAYLSLSRPEGNSQIRFLRHIYNLMNLLSESGKVVIVSDLANPLIQAVLRQDSTSVANRLLAERTEARLNPYARTAEIKGDYQSLMKIREVLPEFAQIWGPVPLPKNQENRHESGILISVPKSRSEDLVQTLRAWVVSRSANKQPQVAIRIDPANL